MNQNSIGDPSAFISIIGARFSCPVFGTPRHTGYMLLHVLTCTYSISRFLCLFGDGCFSDLPRNTGSIPKSAWFADFAKDYQSGTLLSNKELTNVDIESIPITDYSGQEFGKRKKSLINYCSAENFSSLWSSRLAGYSASLDS